MLAWRAHQSSNTTGTGTLTLNAAASSRRSFQAAFGVSGKRVAYVISGASFFEMGYGDFDGGSPGTLTRATVVASSNSGSLVSLPAGTADVYTWIDASQRPVMTYSGATTLALADLGSVILWTGTGPALTTLPAIATVPEGEGYLFRNGGTAVLSLDGNASETVNGVALLPVMPGQSVEILRIGSSWSAFHEGERMVGEILWGAWTTLPARCLLANGQAVSRTTYAALFAVCGTTYGAGDGSTTFNVPNVSAVSSLNPVIYSGV